LAALGGAFGFFAFQRMSRQPEAEQEIYSAPQRAARVPSADEAEPQEDRMRVSAGDAMPSAPLPGVLPGLSRPVTNEDADEIMQVFTKYKDRPVALAFWNEISNDPGLKKMLNDKQAKVNPMALFGQMKTLTSLSGVVQKYMKKPEFINLIQDIARDPQFRKVMARVSPIANQLPFPALPSTSAFSAVNSRPVEVSTQDEEAEPALRRTSPPPLPRQ